MPTTPMKLLRNDDDDDYDDNYSGYDGDFTLQLPLSSPFCPSKLPINVDDDDYDDDSEADETANKR